MDDKTVFYILGGVLVFSALVVSAAGLRSPSFPGSRALFTAVIAYFAVLVAATTTFAVKQSISDPEEREHNVEAVAAANAEGEVPPPSKANGETTTTTTPENPVATTLTLEADPSGQLAFVQTTLSAKPGAVTIDFDNASPVPHDVCLESTTGDELGCTPVGTGTAKLDTQLQPRTYTYYCSVPGHRDAGMEGTLTIG